MILGWFNAKEAIAFGQGLAEFYDMQSKAILKASDRKAAEKQQKLASQVLTKVQQFKAMHKLNAYQKAQLGSAFKWKLRDLGHDSKLVDSMTKDLMIAMR